MSKGDAPDWGSLCLMPNALEGVTSAEMSEEEASSPFLVEGPVQETLAAWKQRVPEVKHLAVSVPASDVLCMVLDLPTQDPAELASMVALQAEEISPFPPERTQVGWEILKPLASGGSRVLLTLLPSQKLDVLHEAFLSTVGIPDRMDVDVLGWIRELSGLVTFPEDRDVWMLLLAGQQGVLVAWHEATPVLIRVLGSLDELTPEVILEELQQARIPVETSFPGRNPASLQLWHTDPLPEGFREGSLLSEFDVFPVPEGVSASQGVLKRCLESGKLDLTPGAWKLELQMQARLRKLMKTAGVALGLWALLLGSFWGWAVTRAVQVEKLEAQNQSQVSTVEEIRVLTDEIRSLSQFTDRSQSALEALRILAESVPGSGSLELEDFRYRKQGSQLFSGTMGRNVQPFNRFLDSLTATKALRVEDYDLKQTRDGYDFRLETEWIWGEQP